MRGYLLTTLQILTIAIAAVQLGVLLEYLTSAAGSDGLLVAIDAVQFAAALAICPLSFFVHGRSIRPSTSLALYLLVSALGEGVQLSSAHHSHSKSGASTILAATSLILRLVLLILESRTKRGYLRDPYKELPTEQTVSNLNRAFLFWVNDIILLGNYKLLLYHDLPALDDKLESRRLRVQMEGLWGRHGKQIIDIGSCLNGLIDSVLGKPKLKDASGHGGALLWALLKFFRGSLLLNAVPRLLMIAFRYSQPIFIKSTIKYVTEPSLTVQGRDDTGYYLILAALVIYVGLAVSYYLNAR